MRLVEEMNNSIARLMNPHLDVRNAKIEDYGVTFVITMVHFDCWNVPHQTVDKCIDIDQAFDIATSFINQ